MITTAMILMLSCPMVIVENRTDADFTTTDYQNMSVAVKRCKVHYPHLPCLVKFVKLGYQNYYAVCGGER